MKGDTMIVRKLIEKWESIRKRAVELSRGNYCLQESELIVVDTFLEDLRSIEKGGDMMERPSEAMLRGPDQTKDGPIGKVESKTTELKAMASDVLDLSVGVESFLLGATPMGVSDKADKKSPAGWLELHWTI